MIVSANQHNFNTTTIFDDSRLGDAFDIDSGLGGSNTVFFQGKTGDGKYVFHQPVREDWPERTYRYDPDNVLSSVFILLPDSHVYREWNMQFVEMLGILYAVEMTYGVVWVEDTEGYFRLKRKNWSVAPRKEADGARTMTKIARKNMASTLVRKEIV